MAIGRLLPLMALLYLGYMQSKFLIAVMPGGLKEHLPYKAAALRTRHDSGTDEPFGERCFDECLSVMTS